MRVMSSRFYIFFLPTILTLFFAGCNSNNENSSAGSLASQTQASIEESLQAKSQSVFLDEATSEDIINYVTECRGRSKRQVCVTICHRPPGNPTRGKTLLLPLKASLAHLSHGHEREENDYLGPCQRDSGLEDETPEVITEDSTEPVEDDAVAVSEDQPETVENVPSTGGEDQNSGVIAPVDMNQGQDPGQVSEELLPPWCQENLAFDSDCDGLADFDSSYLYLQ